MADWAGDASKGRRRELRIAGSPRTRLSVGRHDVVGLTESVAEHAPNTRVICHGDLHLFNLLVNRDDPGDLVATSEGIDHGATSSLTMPRGPGAPSPH